MSAKVEKEIALEIAHILFIDTIGYSKRSINQQRAVVDELSEIVRGSEEYQKAEAAGRLLKIPTGDGMALVFYISPEAPARCALEISRILQDHSDLHLRMGVHSGPVSGVVDVNGHANLAGAGLNMAQRVMACGDAGHILLSKHVAEDLEAYEHWRPLLHEIGACEAKHGMRISVVNLYAEGLGNPQLPQKFSSEKRQRLSLIWATAAAALLVIAAIAISLHHQTRKTLAAPEKSIAVLPFENLSADKANAFFADGIQDDVLTSLAKIHDLKVISRTSVMDYRHPPRGNLREIAQTLGVSSILEGTVRREVGKVRVSVALIDVRSDAQLWAETYDRALADVFSIQSEIAEQIVAQLKAKLSPGEKASIEKPATTDLAAYDLYQRARALYAETSNNTRAMDLLPQAAQLLDQAVARDPQFLLAWCLLSKVHGELYFFGQDHTPARLALAKSAVDTALRLYPDAGEPHLALAYYYYHGFRDFARAREELAKAQRILPNNAEVFEYTSYAACRQGRLDEAISALERAAELDPRNVLTMQQLALTYQSVRRYTEAERAWDRALEITPGDPYTRIFRAEMTIDWRADTKPYQAALAENAKLGPALEDPLYGLCERTPKAAARVLANYPREGVAYHHVNCPWSYWEAVIARWQGDTAKAQAAFTAARAQVAKTVEQQPDFAEAMSLLALIDAGLGRREEAVREGRRACELLPISKDALSGANLAATLALIYAWTGEKDLAIQQLAQLEQVPNYVNEYVSYGLLKLQPQWDPLRGDPRFEQIVASLAPKE
jgi:TolB-like protein/Flp pilus assembly protein TadD